METPTSDFASNGSIEPSEPSTPGTPLEPFEPVFKIKVTEPVKDGENLQYTVKTVRLTEKGEEYKVVRQYEDFEWLHHCLLTQNDVMGLIVPPLPLKPPVEAKGAENKSKQKLGNTSKVVIGDDFNRDCRSLEKYLRLVINHWQLGKDTTLEKFLTESEALTRTKVKKGLFGKITSALEEQRKSGHRDIDDYFQKERDWAAEYSLHIKGASNTFNRMVNSQQRVACAYDHLSTALRLGGGYHDEASVQANKCQTLESLRMLFKMSEALDDSKHGADVDVANDENTLGFQLDLAARYSDAVKEMLYRRTCLLVDYQEANKTLDKAKPIKRAATDLSYKHREQLATAEDAKIAAERAYEECTETARRELQSYHRQRLLALQDGLTLYAEAKIKTARDTNALLAKSLSVFKQMEV